MILAYSYIFYFTNCSPNLHFSFSLPRLPQYCHFINHQLMLVLCKLLITIRRISTCSLSRLSHLLSDITELFESIPSLLGINPPPIYNLPEVWIRPILSFQILLVKLCVLPHRLTLVVFKLHQ